MLRWILVCGVICVAGWFALSKFLGPLSTGIGEKNRANAQPGQRATNERHGSKRAFRHFETSAGNPAKANQPIVVSGSRILVAAKQEVPAEREGKLLFIGTELKPGEEARTPKDELIEIELGILAIEVPKGTPESFQLDDTGKVYTRWRPPMPLIPGKIKLAKDPRKFRKLRVGQRVNKGDLVALIDPDLAMDQLDIKVNELAGKDADLNETNAMKKEADNLHRVALEIADRTSGNRDTDEVRRAKLQVERLIQAQNKAKLAIETARRELNASYNLLKKHEIRAMIPGVIKVMYKSPGDAVKALEPIIQIQNTGDLRVEGLVGIEHAEVLREGMTVNVEATQPDSPKRVLEGHEGSVTCVAVSKGDNPVIVSGSVDKFVRGWDSATGRQLWADGPHEATILAVACTPATSEKNLALVGASDGSLWAYNLDSLSGGPKKWKNAHRGAINAIAFNTDGTLCATSGEDRTILVRKVADGSVHCTIDDSHRAAVTSLHFASGSQLVSAGRDNRLLVWDVKGKKAKLQTQFTRRSGDVARLTSDGKRVLFDQGRSLRIQSLANRQIEGYLENPNGSANFSTMALFSPDGKTILTNGAKQGRLQLWRTPAVNGRGAEVRHYVWNNPITCGAFAPNGSFAVTGTTDNKVLIWSMPSQDEINRKLTAKISLVEKYLDASSLQVRLWADLEEYPKWLVPGSAATMVIDPAQR